MPDYKRTEQIFKAEGIAHLYKKPLEQVDDELFHTKVTNPDTGTFYQIADLPIAYRKFGEDRKYPIRQVLQIIRIKRAGGSEWLKSKGRIVGLDKAGNEVEHSFTDPEGFYKPQTQHEFKRKDPKNENSLMERVCVSAGVNPHSYEYTEYTLPFNEKNFNELFKQRPSKSPTSVSLIIYAEGGSEKPRQITDPGKFKSPFDDLWEEATTPRFKLDRSYGDNLQDSRIK
ncbi:hypothetical protein BH18THE2_BH18THE2_25250 [soil metagenome]